MRLHEISVKKPVAVVMAVLMCVVIGLYSLSKLSIEMTPEMELSMAVVVTQYPNVGSEEVENLITERIEGAVSSVSGVDTVSSQSSEGSSMTMVQFNSGTDMDKAVSDMEGNINMIKSYLPDDATDPMILKINTDMMATAQFSVSYDGYDLVQTKKYVEDNLESKLKSAAGVASVSTSGAQDREIDVYIDPTKVFGYDMSITDIANAIMAQNQNLPAGNSKTMGRKFSARIFSKFDSVSDIESVPIMTKSGQVINLRDVAEVKDTYGDVSTIARLNGEDAISVTVSKESDANTVDVVDAITKVLDDLHASNPKFTYNMTMEQGSMIKEAINTVADNAVSGALLAIIVLILFLGSIKTSLVIGVSMPISVITTFIGMYFSGMSLNVVSLGGLALGVGMLVDNSVVVLENIFRHRSLGKDANTASIQGSGEVVGAVIASVLTTCIVYVPILFIDNMMAIMFKQLAFSIIFSQIASLLVTFHIVPMLSARIKDTEESGKKTKVQKIISPFTKLLDAGFKAYEKSVRAVLKKRKTFIFIVLVIFVISMVGLFMVGMELMPSTDSGTVSVSITMPSGTEIEETDEMTTQIENIIKENKNVKTVFSQVGSGGDAESMISGVSNSDKAAMTLTLEDSDKRKLSDSDVIQQIREALKGISGADIEVSGQSMTMSSSSDEISMRFTASDDDVLEEYVLEAEKLLAKQSGVVETSTSISDTKNEIRIRPNRNKSLMYGFTPATESVLIKNIISGVTAGQYEESGSEYDIKVKYPSDYADTYEKLKAMQLKTPSGSWVAVSDIADVSVEESYSTLLRVNRKRVITLSGKLYGVDIGTATANFQRELAKLPNPGGVSTEAAGTYETMIDAMQQLLIAILLGILLMYMIMAAQFGNTLHPLIILSTIPLAMIGVTLSLVVSGSRLSAVSCIGILMLLGIVVNNAIVLIDFINQSREENPAADRNELVVNAGITRMRPVLMTSLTSILGFLPMAMGGSSSGTSMMQPLAVVLLGGLLVGTFLTLYVIPVVYTIVDNKIIKHRAKKEKRKLKKAMKKADVSSDNREV